VQGRSITAVWIALNVVGPQRETEKGRTYSPLFLYESRS
jgi:hypothetical protein